MDNITLPGGVEEQLKALKEAYRRRLPDKVTEIIEQWESVKAAPGDTERINALILLIHRLAGSGATYGFSLISEAASALEQGVKLLLRPENKLEAPQLTEIEHLLERLKLLVNHKTPLQPATQPDPADENKLIDKLIFVVEPDTQLAADLVNQLGNFGYMVRNFDSTLALAEAFEMEKPVAVVADLALVHGKKAGTKILPHLSEGQNRIPLLFISALNDIYARLEAVQAGGSAYFTVPPDINSLVDMLDKLIDQHRPEMYRVLIVDDDPDLAEYYSLTLEKAGMATQTLTEPMKIIGALVDFRPDLILMDMYLPECSGLDLASLIRQQEAYVSIPIVFLSADNDLNQQLAALRLGGDDLLNKSIQPEYLVSSVIARAERSRVLRSFMVRDSLTGLLNHTRIKEQLVVELARARRTGSPLTYALIDMDNFKRINDTYGHPIGDRVIKSLSRLLQQRLRKTDVIGRYGGEEFAVILPGTDLEAGYHVMEELRVRFEQIRQWASPVEFKATFSCGVAFYPAYDDPSELTNAADRALYEAKRTGRNKVVKAH